MEAKGIILWVGFALICAVIYLVSRRMKKLKYHPKYKTNARLVDKAP